MRLPHPSTILLAFCIAFILCDIIITAVVPDFFASKQLKALNGKDITISGRIVRDPTESASGKFSLTLTDLKLLQPTAEPPPASPESIPGTLFTQLNSLEISDVFTLQRSDTIIIQGQLAATSSDSAATIFRPEIKGVSRPEPGDAFLKIRNFFAERIKDYIPAPQNGLALGYLLGQKSGVDSSLQSALRTVGLTHIIVASGAHLSALTKLAKKLFKRFSRFAGYLSAALLTLLFIGITGLSASMLRAGLVTLLSLLLGYFGREIHPLRLIILVATATLIYNPAYLTDLAWLLSFASFTGILVLAPAITRFLYGKTRQPNFIFATLISSLAAALLCTPILLYFFGQTSLISILANLLVLPTISITMGLSFLTGIFALIFPPLANILGHLTTLILDYQISVVNFFGEQRIFLIEIDTENPAVFLLYIPLAVVIIIAAWYAKFKLRKKSINLSLEHENKL